MKIAAAVIFIFHLQRQPHAVLPRARQVADRYHLLVNLRDALKGTLARTSGSLPEVAGERGEPRASSQTAMASLQAPHAPENTAPQDQREVSGARPLTVAEQRRQISRANRLARYEQIITLHRQGLSQRAIARRLHVSRKVVHRSMRARAFPERAPTGRRQSKLDPYLPYLRKRWEQGCHNGRQLAREIQARGFRGSASSVGKLTGDWRARLPGPAALARAQETTGSSAGQASSVTPTRILVVRHRPAAAHGRPAGAH